MRWHKHFSSHLLQILSVSHIPPRSLYTIKIRRNLTVRIFWTISNYIASKCTLWRAFKMFQNFHW